MKKHFLCLILILIMVAVSAGQAKADDDPPLEVKLELPSAADPRSQGKVDIEKSFIESAQSGNIESMHAAIQPDGGGGQELPIVYAEQEDQTNPEVEREDVGSAPAPLWLILAVPILAIVGIFVLRYLLLSGLESKL